MPLQERCGCAAGTHGTPCNIARPGPPFDKLRELGPGNVQRCLSIALRIGFENYMKLHQGTKMIPCDFIAPANSHNKVGDHHKKLLSNFFAQPEALMNGKTLAEATEELRKDGKSEEEIAFLAPHKVFEGNITRQGECRGQACLSMTEPQGGGRSPTRRIPL